MAVIKFRGFQKKSNVFTRGDGFYFYKNRIMSGGRMSLRCSLYKKCQCQARAVIDGEQDLIPLSRHNHPRNRDLLHVRTLRRAILDRCRTRDPTAFPDIVQEEGFGYRLRVQAENHHVRLRSSMRRARLENYPNIPETINELGDLLRDPQYRRLTMTKDGRDNLFRAAVGSTALKTRAIIFMSKRMMKQLRIAKRIFADGTWKARPAKPDSSQLFSICRTWKHHVIPVAVVLMQSRKRRAYEKVFQTLKDLGLKPRSIHCDFEKAQFRAWQRVFPRSRILGCLFHYVTRLKRQSKKLYLTRFLKRNNQAASLVRSCGSIPLLPRRELRKGLLTLVRAARRQGHLRRLLPFFRYVKKEWLSKEAILSVHAAPDRTNNVSESWNKMVRLAGRVKRPNLWRFLDALRNLEQRVQLDLHILKGGGKAKRLRKASAVANDAKIRQLDIDLHLGNITMLAFLKRSSRRMQNVWNPIM